jgi:hypothetical protein
MMFPANIWIKISARDRAAYRRASRMKHGFARIWARKRKCLPPRGPRAALRFRTTSDEITTTAEAVTYGRG